MPVVAIALGSNLGDRRAHLEWAVEQLASILIDPRISSLVETDPAVTQAKDVIVAKLAA